jgi:DNA-binding SARP family transcriptional activator
MPELRAGQSFCHGRAERDRARGGWAKNTQLNQARELARLVIPEENPMMPQRFRYRLLGPLAAEYAGEHIRLGGLRQQILLAMLLEANQVVHLERLIDAIWDESPPASARSQVRICVSGLRRLFAAKGGGDVIETHPVGYRIVVAKDVVDFYQFEELAASGRAAAAAGQPGEAVTLLRSALSLWTGPIAAGLDSALVRATAVKLQEDRMSVLEDCFDLELQLGQQRRIIGELTSHVMDHPFREKLCAQLMLALYQSGRQVDALECFLMTRKRFSGELGIEPSENLRALEHRILTNDPSLREHCPPESLTTARPLPQPPPLAEVLTLRVHAGNSQHKVRASEHAAIKWRRTEDRLERLERENAWLRAEYDVFKRVMGL